MTDLGKDPDDRGAKRKGVKGPRRDVTKRTRSTKDQNGTTDIGASETGQADQTSGKESAPASTTTGRSTIQTSPPKEAKRSPGKAGRPQLRTGERTDAAKQEVSTPASQNHERIARRAYALYEASGYRGDDALQHWLEAERELCDHEDDSTHEN